MLSAFVNLKQGTDEPGDREKVIKIDEDQNPKIASLYQIQSVPTIMIFKNGAIIHKQAGVHTKLQIMGILINNL